MSPLPLLPETLPSGLGWGYGGRADLRTIDRLPAPFLTSSVLCCFAFSLSQDWELPVKREVRGWGWSSALQPAIPPWGLLGVGQAGCLCWQITPDTSWVAEAGPVGSLSADLTWYTSHSGPSPRAAHDRGCPCVQEEKKPLKEGVQDMLVKHHLFSWDIDG